MIETVIGLVTLVIGAAAGFIFGKKSVSADVAKIEEEIGRAHV